MAASATSAESGAKPLTLLGLTQASCPYCQKPLAKFPGRKTKCKACGNFIFVRTRPVDKARILVRSDQLVEVEEEWAIANGTHDQFLAARQRREEIAAQLRVKFGRDPSASDIEWAILTEDSIKHLNSWNWGLYRNCRFDMAELLLKDSKYAEAVQLLLEVCYLDLNGAMNTGGGGPTDLCKPYNLEFSFLASGVLWRLKEAVELAVLDSSDLGARFVDVATRTRRSLGLPRDVDESWHVLHDSLVAT